MLYLTEVLQVGMRSLIMSPSRSALRIVSILTSFLLIAGLTYGSEGVQCYACGLQKINPEHDSKGSYPKLKTYNHSCDEMMHSLVNGRISNKYIRSCPSNVAGCFIATGYYDRGDWNPYNDIRVTFLGCSEPGRSYKVECENGRDEPPLIDDPQNKNSHVSIDVKICFCNSKLCNDPRNERMTISSNNGNSRKFFFYNIGCILAILIFL